MTRAVRWLMMLSCLACASLRAHDPGLSTAEIVIRGDRLEVTTGFAPDDARYFLPPGARGGDRWNEENFEDARPGLLAAAPTLWEVRVGEKLLGPRETRVELLPGDNVSFYLVFPGVSQGGKLTLRAPRLGDLPSGHRQFVIVSDHQGLALTKKLMKATDAVIEVDLPGASGTVAGSGGPAPASHVDMPTFWGFLKLGVMHIWKGYDHLLFLFALLIVCRSFRSIVAIISFFTVAHSITLAVATFDWVKLPSTLVEAAIAASIVFVGIENLVRRGEEPRGRWALTFAFGLVHGFGFASVLRELPLGRGGGIAMPLFSFNLGVELGQVAIAALVLPIIWRLRKQDGFVQRGVPALSALVAMAGLYWLLERTVWG